MLHQTVVSVPQPGVGWETLRRGIYAGPGAWLKQLVLVFTIACILTCAYLWQSSAIAELEADTLRTRRALRQLEQDNVALMVQVAQWNRPAYIEEQAQRHGMVTGRLPVVIEVPWPTVAEETRPMAGPLGAEMTAWGRWLLGDTDSPTPAPPQAAAWVR